ncbi:MAG TPA: hypothetical protein VK717_11130 [Opitutaceae bacterium]|nr:hypothetical protein [Opitutaceae bacterium]
MALLSAFALSAPVVFAQARDGGNTVSSTAANVAAPAAQGQPGLDASGGAGLQAADPAPHNAPAAARVNISSTLNEPGIVRDIHTSTFASRDSLTGKISDRIDASEQAAAALKDRAKAMDAVSRAKFNSALSIVKANEKKLKDSLQEARKATPETWEHSQLMLEYGYETYADAMTQLNAAAQT